MTDTFNGDNARLIESINALLELDASGSLVPHGVGGHARQLLSAAAARLVEREPMQPLVVDARGTVRFKENAIVRHLLDHGGIDMNKIAMLDFSKEDRMQFAQLIGYSVSGYGELSYVSDESYDRAAAGVEAVIERGKQ
jgi:predicted esterase